MSRSRACWPVALVLLGPALASGPARSPGVTVLPSVQISADEPESRHVESWLAVNPREPRNLIAAAIVFGKYSGVAAYASQDAGKSWVRATHGARAERYFEGLDPAVAFDADGNAYLLTLSRALAVWKSTDGGLTWGEPAVVPGAGYDRPFIACDRSLRGPYRGRVYVSAKMPITILGSRSSDDVVGVASSRDGGATFGFPRLLAAEKEIVDLASDLLVAPDGKMILALETFEPQDLGAPLVTAHYSIIVSRDGGRTFSDPRRVAVFRAFGRGRDWQSVKGGAGAHLAMDTSAGSRRGTLYAVWLDASDGFFQVMVAASPDGGETWSRPVRVNDNRTASNQSTPAIAVNDEGVVAVSWNDRRNDPSDSCYQPFVAVSLDGGATFLPNVEVAKQPTCPNGQHYREVDFDPLNPAHRFLNGGDTQGLVSLPDGSFHLAWIGGQGVMQLWSAVVVPPSDQRRPRPPP